MVRSQVLGARLAGAATRLRTGGVLEKYRAGGRSHERHARRVWVSNDLQRLCWAPVGALDAKASAVRSVEMSKVAAVSNGAKTALLKKVKARAHSGFNLFARRLPLADDCAFSLIGSERTLDFVAPDAGARRQWMRDLRTLLLYAHHLDAAAAAIAVKAAAVPRLSEASVVAPASLAAMLPLVGAGEPTSPAASLKPAGGSGRERASSAHSSCGSQRASFAEPAAAAA